MERLSKVDMATFRELMTDAEFTTDSRVPLKKPVFFFGDNIGTGGYTLHDGDYKWLRQIEVENSFFQIWRECTPYLISSICLSLG